MQVKFSTEELRPLALFEGLLDSQIGWFCDHGEKIEIAAGEHMFERGQAADFMFLVVTGKIEGYEEIGGEWLLVATTAPGRVTGMLPFSRMTNYPRYTVAAEPSTVLRVKKTDFQEMLTVSLEVGQRLVAEMSDRVRGDVRHEQQREKMISLGRLSAGLAHELNNPAAAVRRAAAELSERLERLRTLRSRLLRLDVDESETAAIDQFCTLARERAPSHPSPLERSEREEELNEWLEDHDVTDAWRVAGTLSDQGLTAGDLDELAGKLKAEQIPDVMAWLEGELGTDHILSEIGSSAKRISELIASVKTYSHMDRSPEHKPTDVREGLDNTLTMLGHKIKKKDIQLIRDYQDDLPAIKANAGELNQVWTNLIDNALDALDEGGELRIEAKRDDSNVTVRVIDSGPGIPNDIRARIFEPFFTTKDVGQGTGLGLDIALRIVKTHQGQIDVASQPGRTEMSVRLPSEPAPPSGKHAAE
jgi:signal transduction histidine kinase